MKAPPQWVSCGSLLFFCAVLGAIVWNSLQPSSADLAQVRQSLARMGYAEVEITGLALCGADGVSFRARDRDGVLIESEACAHDETVRTWFVMLSRPVEVNPP